MHYGPYQVAKVPAGLEIASGPSQCVIEILLFSFQFLLPLVYINEIVVLWRVLRRHVEHKTCFVNLLEISNVSL